jgi:hypothetical protein
MGLALAAGESPPKARPRRASRRSSSCRGSGVPGGRRPLSGSLHGAPCGSPRCGGRRSHRERRLDSDASQCPIIFARTLLAHVVGDCATRFSWKRKNGASACLPCAQAGGPTAPVDVLQMRGGNLTGPKPQGLHARHDGAVPVGTRRGGVERHENLLELLIALASRQRRRPPMRHGGDCGFEPPVAWSLHPHECKERPQRRAPRLRRTGREPAPHGVDELQNVGETSPCGVDQVVEAV